MNPDIQRERRNATFSVDEMTYILDGGEGITQRRRDVENLALQEPIFSGGEEYSFLSREEKYDLGMKKSAHYIKKMRELNLDSPADAYWYRTDKDWKKHPYFDPEDVFSSMAFPNESPPIGLHTAMFMPALNSHASAEQLKKWLPLSQKYNIVGTYAQTEMGHGTHLRGVETTATYDPNTEEFVLNSPTLTSTKWWPGGLGKTSNYVILMANLHTKGQNCGMQAFIVQIRDMDTHQPLPGVTVGDIGPKLAYEMIDNGFLRFDHVRIPRDQMLMKNAQILKDGTFVASKNKKLSYGTMVFVRAMIVMDVGARGLAQATTIAVRYSTVRRQSELKPGAPEPQVLDYQTQQYKLLPLLAGAYCSWFGGTKMRDIYFTSNYEIQQGNTESLPELHALSACLKAFTTDATMFGIEQCRLACGGHGYSLASGLPKIYGICTPGCTYEGENTVLYLQTARALLKAHLAAKSGTPQLRTMAYISEPVQRSSNTDAQLNLKSLAIDYKHRAARLVQKAGVKYEKLVASGRQDWEARNLAAVDFVKASKAHAHQWLVQNFVDVVNELDCSAPVRKVLATLAQLYCVYGIVGNSGDFLEDGYMTSSQIDLIQERMLELLAEVRPNAVALVDSFDFKDEILSSVLGRYDGNVYENLYKWAKAAPLNKKEVHDSFYKYMKPLRQEMKASSKL